MLYGVIGIYKQYVVETQKKGFWMMNIVPLINKQYVVETQKKDSWMMNIVSLINKQYVVETQKIRFLNDEYCVFELK